MKLHRM